MSQDQGEKTEQPTQRKLEEAVKEGRFARSAEVQTAFVIMAVLMALLFTSREIWGRLVMVVVSTLSHLHDTPLTETSLQGYLINGVVVLGQCVWPIIGAAVIAGLVAGGIQSRFQTASEALGVKWERLNPVAGFQRMFSFHSTTTTLIAVAKLAAIICLAYAEVKSIAQDPIFFSVVSPAGIAEFLGNSAFRITLRIAFIICIIAAADYGYQWWKTHKELMMTKEEVKEEAKSSEGNPEVKAQQRRRRSGVSKRKMLLEVPKADVIVTNPTHLAVALRYDRKTMRAPKVIAKGSRLNALRIREIAKQHQVPILENKPLARMMFKHCRVGGEVPADLYAAVAEVLAWVYRVNRYKYYTEQNQA